MNAVAPLSEDGFTRSGQGDVKSEREVVTDVCTVSCWVFLPPVTTAADACFVLDGVLAMLNSGERERKCWIIDLGGLCRDSNKVAAEIVRFIDAAVRQGHLFRVTGTEWLPVATHKRITVLMGSSST